jgi:hypothetical protein
MFLEDFAKVGDLRQLSIRNRSTTFGKRTASLSPSLLNCGAPIRNCFRSSCGLANTFIKTARATRRGAKKSMKYGLYRVEGPRNS